MTLRIATSALLAFARALLRRFFSNQPANSYEEIFFVALRKIATNLGRTAAS